MKEQKEVMDPSVKILSKRDILKYDKLEREIVPVPELGGAVIVQEMTGGGRDEFDAWCVSREEGDYHGTRLRVFINTVVDEKGNLLFSELDLPDLVKKSGRGIAKAAEVGMRLSGIGENVEEALVKNSDPVLKEDSTSD